MPSTDRQLPPERIRASGSGSSSRTCCKTLKNGFFLLVWVTFRDTSSLISGAKMLSLLFLGNTSLGFVDKCEEDLDAAFIWGQLTRGATKQADVFTTNFGNKPVKRKTGVGGGRGAQDRIQKSKNKEVHQTIFTLHIAES